MTTWVALLRGINVGGHRRVAMADLRDALDAAGFHDVRTYIQSGNVLFESDAGSDDAPSLAVSVASVVDRACGLAVPVLVRRLDDIERVATAHPDRGGEVDNTWLHVFLFDRPVTATDELDPVRFAPDRWMLAEREMFVTYPSGSGRSKLTIDVVERAFGVVATARNLSTLEAIVRLGHRR